jgi:hypothetical protein
MGEVVPRCGTGSLMKIIVWGEKCVWERAEKGYFVLAFCSWLMSFGEFMYGKMRCAYMTSCVAAEGEVLLVRCVTDNKDMEADRLR